MCMLCTALGRHWSIVFYVLASNLGSIQEDRRKVEQFHLLWNSPAKKWNSSTICGTASQKCGTAPQKVEQVLKAGRYSTNCGTAPQLPELMICVTIYYDLIRN